ncbi:4473_t:CDS:2, partial [Racocetra fulgida]
DQMISHPKDEVKLEPLLKDISVLETSRSNNFVWALGFLTPLLKHIGAENATEIVINSTFKTNQERFELFAINLNCGGYGMPIAYLYFSSKDGSEEVQNSQNNLIKTQIEVLRIFFTSLHQEGLRPVFILTDKDA